ncbi:MAG: carbohydrate kinase family protein [Candidatus Pacebacteria bacterium]|jgi:sugar/nucleoside kinase (ribokinase family)|nr:carbohydrate kinase family protein [Candidatus Paceibacterota bacterium]|tara:strand:+ start:9601 stop:10599 length:999 start_codon:yes stop_codon:yes gene_type:complete
MEKLDFVAIGDITTDAFIRLSAGDARIQKDAEERKTNLCLNFGDKIEYESVTEVPAVGNSPNAAVSAHRLGLNSAIVTNLGDDYNGKIVIKALEREGINTNFVKVHVGKESNYHYVLWYEEERTILVKHHEYPYELPDIGKPKWIYLSSLGENSLPFHSKIAKYVKDDPEVNLAFQPGTFQMQLGYEKLKDIYEVSDLFFSNLQEAQRILKTQESDIKKLLESIHALGPKIVVITDGPKGAFAYDGSDYWQMPMYPDPKPPTDRTGAGDSFSSTVTSALALGKTLPDALMFGPVNSMSVVQYVGAQEGLLTKEKLQQFLAEAPENYKPIKIN